VATSPDGQVALLRSTAWGEAPRVLSGAQREMLRELAVAEQSEADLVDRFGAQASTLLDRLRAGGWLTVSLAYRGRPLITIVPQGPNPRNRDTLPVCPPTVPVRPDAPGRRRAGARVAALAAPRSGFTI
jgi:antitoxin (DNA-binding transcriptional repressor) of toxin-antitoxin stability system